MSHYKYSIKDIVGSLSELDVIVLNLLWAQKNKPIKDKTHFQKEVFLIAKYDENIWEDADFIPHTYGPYSEPVENSVKNLIALGLAQTRGDSFFLTDIGKQIIPQFHIEKPKEIFEAIEDFKTFLNDLTYEELLLFIYVSYPNFAIESTEKNKILENRVNIAKSIYRKDKVSIKKAAYLSDLSIEDFLQEVRTK